LKAVFIPSIKPLIFYPELQVLLEVLEYSFLSLSLGTEMTLQLGWLASEQGLRITLLASCYLLICLFCSTPEHYCFHRIADTHEADISNLILSHYLF